MRSIVGVNDDAAFFGVMPAFVRGMFERELRRGSRERSGGRSSADSGRGRPGEQARGDSARSARSSSRCSRATPRAGCIRTSPRSLLLDPETGALRALLDGRFITESRTARRLRRVVAPARAQDRFVARHHRIGRPGAESSRGAVARPQSASGHGVEPEQRPPRPVRRSRRKADWCPGSADSSDRAGRPYTVERRSTMPAKRWSAPTSSCWRPHRRRRSRKRLGQAGRARDFGGRLPADPARNGSRARRARAAVRGFTRGRARRIRRRRDRDSGRPLRPPTTSSRKSASS